ncbi:hypothetical protein ACFPRL_25980 [Pseudoclavibacter helvolus]
MRDQGHELQAEVFVVPHEGHALELAELEQLTQDCRELDWKLQDVVLIPVADIPSFAYRDLKPIESSPESQEHA